MARKNAEDINETEVISEVVVEKSEVQQTKEIAKSQSIAKAERKIYVGASLPGLLAYTVIEGDLPQVAEREYIKDLIIGVSELTAFKKRQREKGSREDFLYRKSIEISKEMKLGVR